MFGEFFLKMGIMSLAQKRISTKTLIIQRNQNIRMIFLNRKEMLT